MKKEMTHEKSAFVFKVGKRGVENKGFLNILPISKKHWEAGCADVLREEGGGVVFSILV